MTLESWLPVLAAPGYEVSDHGQLRRATARGWRPVPQSINRDGYPRAAIREGDRQRTVSVHVLVAAAFHGPRPEGFVVRHLDGRPANNQSSNLKYGTQGENARDKRRHGTDHNVNKTHCAKGHPYDADNTYVYVSRSGDPRRCCRICNLAAAMRIYDRHRLERGPAAERTHCKRGHLLAESNLDPSWRKRGRRTCRSCEAARKRVQLTVKRGRVCLLKFQPLTDQYYERFCMSGESS